MYYWCNECIEKCGFNELILVKQKKDPLVVSRGQEPRKLHKDVHAFRECKNIDDRESNPVQRDMAKHVHAKPSLSIPKDEISLIEKFKEIGFKNFDVSMYDKRMFRQLDRLKLIIDLNTTVYVVQGLIGKKTYGDNDCFHLGQLCRLQGLEPIVDSKKSGKSKKKALEAVKFRDYSGLRECKKCAG